MMRSLLANIDQNGKKIFDKEIYKMSFFDKIHIATKKEKKNPKNIIQTTKNNNKSSLKKIAIKSCTT